jgi:hypothetical protein
LQDLAIETYNGTAATPSIWVGANTGPTGFIDPSTNVTTYYDRVTIVLTAALPGALMYYTLDNTEPIAGIAPLYTQPILLTAPRSNFQAINYTIKVISVKQSLAFPSTPSTFNLKLQRLPAVCPMGCEFGTCVDDDVCQCDIYHQNAKFNNCSEEIPSVWMGLDTQKEDTVYRAKVLGGLNGVFIALDLIIGGIIFWFRKATAIRTSTWQSMVLMVLGCVLAQTSLFFILVKPTTFTCNIRHWLLACGMYTRCHVPKLS